MKKWANKVKKGLGIEEQSFSGQGRKLGGKSPEPARNQQQESRPVSSGVVQARKVDVGSRSASSNVQPQQSLVGQPSRQLCNDFPDVYKALQQVLGDSNRNEALRMLHRVLSNILKDPKEQKVRRLRLQNAKIQESIVNCDGGIELLQACGFEIVFEQPESQSDDTEVKEEGFLVLPVSSDEHGQDGLQVVRAAVSEIGSILRLPAAGAPQTAVKSKPEFNSRPPDDRHTVLELPTPVEADVPDWFFEQSSQEVKALYVENRKKLEQSKVLMTRAMREKLDKRNRKPPVAVFVVKVRAPEGTRIRGDFNPNEPIQALFAWVADCLADPMLEFDLVMPDRRKLGDSRFEEKSIRESGLEPATVLNLMWTGHSITMMKNRPAFREDF